MADQENYTVEFTKDEIWSLNEILAKFRGTYADMKNPKEDALFVATGKLHHKIAHVISPDSNVPLEDFMGV